MEKETTEPEESPQEGNCRANRALFSHFPTRISCHAVLDRAACALFHKEKRMNCANATKPHRKPEGETPKLPIAKHFVDLPASLPYANA